MAEGEVSVRVTPRFITVRSADYPMAKTGGKVDELTKLGLTIENQVFLHLAKMQRLTMMTGVPLTQVDGAVFRGRLDADRKLIVEAQCKNTAQAKGILNLVELGMKQMRQGMKSGGPRSFKGDPEACEALLLPKFERDEEVITARWDGGQLTYAKFLNAVLGVKGAVSTQDGPRK